MAKKYKVEANGRFLGHYYAKDGLTAVQKAVTRNVQYHPEICSEDCMFAVSKQSDTTDYYTWSNMVELAKIYQVPVADVA